MLDSFQVCESAAKEREDVPRLCGTAGAFGGAVFRFRSDSKAGTLTIGKPNFF